MEKESFFYFDSDAGLVVPMANEEPEFFEFIEQLKKVLLRLPNTRVYLVVDEVSKDKTRALCEDLETSDSRFKLIWSPENRNLVDAYMSGYRSALQNGHEIIIEMDAGLSHDPSAIPMFLRVLNEGNECAFGSRFINGGSMTNSPYFRKWLSKTGTLLSNVLLGSKLYDMTSGYQGFHSDIVRRFLDYKFLSTGHFYQTELRYLLRKSKFREIPIHYKAPSNNVSKASLINSLSVLVKYFLRRMMFFPAAV